MKIKDDNRGFSMVELIVSIAIMAIIVSVASVSVLRYLDRAREVKALTEARAIYATAQYAVINASVEEKDAFQYAVKFEETVNGVTMRLGRFSNQSLYKYLIESNGGSSQSNAKSKKADYYIASQLANSIPGADGTIEEDTLKDKSPIGDTHSTKYISENPQTYGNVVFAMAYNSKCEIVYFQCVYDGYFITSEGGVLKAEKVSDSTKFNDWPRTRAAGADGW
ncbi:MAG: type II secretion system GspH family protein [Alistipes sp.]|nr:type II secretion system GspH family protein [Alistipes sp.]